MQIFSFSPGITYTGMLPGRLASPVKRLFQRLLYSPDASLWAPLAGLFSPALKGGAEYWSNAPLFSETTALGRVLMSLLRGGGALASAAMLPTLVLSAFHQRYYYGQLTVTPVNEACGDVALTEGLYKWSLAEVHRYSFGSKQPKPVSPVDAQCEEVQEIGVEMASQ